jgi:hypothetical protein
MAKLSITLGDDNNKEYRKEVEVEVDGTTALLIRDRCRTADADDYGRAWDNMLYAIETQYPDLPRDWYVYHIER